jgi:ribonuclease D
MKNNSNYHSKIIKEKIHKLPTGKFEGTIYLIDTLNNIESIKDMLRYTNVFGFDTETRPSFKKGIKNNISLLQLATSDSAFLFRINFTGIPEFLIRIFEDKDITKVGVAIRDDLKGLKKIRPFNPKGFTDLQQYVEVFGIEDKGLRKLAANILGLKISKGQQTSNWENKILNKSQLVYAATDAWVCCEIFNKLTRHT